VDLLRSWTRITLGNDWDIIEGSQEFARSMVIDPDDVDEQHKSQGVAVVGYALNSPSFRHKYSCA
jgi:hypothetical protein